MFLDTNSARAFVAAYANTADIDVDIDVLVCRYKQEQLSGEDGNRTFAAIWSKAIGIVTTVAQSIAGGALSSADVYSSALEVLQRSVQKWTPEKSTKFSSYFYTNMQRQFYTLTHQKHFRDFHTHTLVTDFTDAAWIARVAENCVDFSTKANAASMQQQLIQQTSVCDPEVTACTIPYETTSPEYEVINCILHSNIHTKKDLRKALKWENSHLSQVLMRLKKGLKKNTKAAHFLGII